jgi:TPR repeat protein
MIEKSQEDKVKDACDLFCLGDKLYFGEDVAKNMDKSIALYKAAEKGHPFAQGKLKGRAVLKDEGITIEKDFQNDRNMFQQVPYIYWIKYYDTHEEVS